MSTAANKPPVLAKKLKSDSLKTDFSNSKSTSADESIASKQYRHPNFNKMVLKAIRDLNDSSGSSRVAILKYISQNYDVSPKTINNNVKRSIRRLADNKLITRTSLKVTGANGSFKLSAAGIRGQSSIVARMSKDGISAVRANRIAPKKRIGSPKKRIGSPKKRTPKKALATKKKASVKKTQHTFRTATPFPKVAMKVVNKC